MRVIFLDIDGVLVTLESFTVYKVSGSHAPAHPDCVKALNRILRETGARIVVSSAWRAPRRLGWLRSKFAEWGIHAAKSRTIGMTPHLPRYNGVVWLGKERGDEIQAWLDAHPEVESFVILDDDADMKHLMPRLVQSTFEKGLTISHAEQAIAMLSSAVIGDAEVGIQTVVSSLK